MNKNVDKSIKETVLKYNPDNVIEEDYPAIKLFGKDILLEAQTQFDNETSEEDAQKIVFDATSKRIRELLRADNFSILTGAGSSYNHGGVLFSNKELTDGWVSNIFLKENYLQYKNDYEALKQLFEKNAEDKENYGVEDFITFLVKLDYVAIRGGRIEKNGRNILLNVPKIRKAILNELSQKCRLPSNGKEKEINNTITFIKRILSRPVNLRRTNLFTTNYDLVFEKAMDELGVIYVDGFIGGLKKFFHPEAFNYDYYYPAATTEGKVSRLERVIHLYKLHGSLNWTVSNDNSFLNVYGIEKKPEEQIPDNGKEVLIYPTPMKESDTLGFPYSEIFRRFANTIQQPQSVLLTYGYSFGDAHINRIMFEALSIPSFQLIIVSYNWSENIKKIYDKFKNEPSVGFIIGPNFAQWQTFTNHILPDLPSQDLEEKYQQKREQAKSCIYSKKGNGYND